MKSLKKKLFLVISLSISLLFGAFGALFFSDAFKTVYAEEQYVLEVVKVTLYQKDGDNENLYYYNGTEFAVAGIENRLSEVPFELSKYQSYNVIEQEMEENVDNVFMLNNANKKTETVNISGQDVDFTSKQYLLVRFLPNKISDDEYFDFINLSVNATLSGSHYSIEPVNINTLEKTTSATSEVYYAKLFDLENTYLLNTSQPDGLGDKLNEYDAQGKYTFSFTYNVRDKQGRVETNINKTTEFYLLSENYYINQNSTDDKPRDNVQENGHEYQTEYSNNYDTNNIYTEPRLFNTERIDRTNYTGEYQLEQNYFSYSNQFTVDYNGNQNNQSSYLYYPTLKYDATKYNLSYTRTMSGVTYTITSVLDTTGAYPKLVLTEKNSLGNITSIKEMTDVVPYNYTFGGKTYTGYITTIIFEDVGKYVFDFDYTLNDYVFVSTASNLKNIEKQNWNKIGSDQLTIFGYQLMHSDYKRISGSTEKEVKYISYDKITDLTSEFDTFNTYEYDE